MKGFISALVLSSGLATVGCSLFIPKETLYLLSAKDRATQQEVRQHLGQPSFVTLTKGGQAVWGYDIQEFVQGGSSIYDMTGDWWCDNYRLTFDVSGILRDWTHTSRKCG